MKLRLNKYFSPLFVGMILLIIAVGLNSCSNESLFNPNTSQEEQHTQITQETSSENNFKYVSRSLANQDGKQSLNKTQTQSKYINKEKGGTLKLRNSNDNFAYFTVESGAIDYSKTISMSLDDEHIEFEFGPSGTTFEPAAKLSFYFTGLDLTDLEADKIKFYYLQSDGKHDVIPTEEIVINTEMGTIIVKNAQISHFSRYALGQD